MASEPIINPNNLKIEGWYCQDSYSKRKVILLTKDVRDIVPQGIAVDDHDALSDPGELIRLKEILSINFKLLDKPVVTDQQRKVGKVKDYACEMHSLSIQKLYVSQPVLRNISGGQLTIDRTQIIEITDKQITVRDVDIKVGSPITAALGIR